MPFDDGRDEQLTADRESNPGKVRRTALFWHAVDMRDS
ncbi:hypothetical protein I603_1555 [Erythrobacter dokdonensis DSW-74]|uniref:Uncharacterized protein n=1 Tax=Erythrobacter dokdonensis DSW-74 TaxID=1300349 RepID=A0A1A7BI74_9SPHN|nr:hypothetical protein I603_1555 [Erythrobacter dokdonensis DSW-74]